MHLDTSFIRFDIKDHILVCTYKKNLQIDIEIARKIVDDRLHFTGYKKMPVMIISQGVVSVDKPAREYLASEEATCGLTATAIIVDTAYSSFLGNFFLMVNKTKMPVKIFSNISMAGKWLQQFIVK